MVEKVDMFLSDDIISTKEGGRRRGTSFLQRTLKESTIIVHDTSTPHILCMADPERDSGFVYNEQGLVDILQSPFFDLNPEVDDSVDEYVECIIFTLSNAIEEQLFTVQGQITAKPRQGPVGIVDFVKRAKKGLARYYCLPIFSCSIDLSYGTSVKSPVLCKPKGQRLRGAMAFALALQSVHDLPEGHGKTIFTATTAIVVLTVVAYGDEFLDYGHLLEANSVVDWRVLLIGGSTGTVLESLEVVGDVHDDLVGESFEGNNGYIAPSYDEGASSGSRLRTRLQEFHRRFTCFVLVALYLLLMLARPRVDLRGT
ncbi:hypothetical protein M5K25_015821 [Dendrobium thyrsiflorum]|uniref:Uncharacterized protein n=1 Tax=Dendrobium thyrsiflorum TaxID=117978 RepID=A0ABD0URB5_DENTH